MKPNPDYINSPPLEAKGFIPRDEWVATECHNPNCRHLKQFGKPKSILAPKGYEKTAQCNECFGK